MSNRPIAASVDAVEPSKTKARILSAASALFLKGGIGALSVRAIAREAGLSTMGIYSHFQGKQGVLDALYMQGFARLGAAMDSAAAHSDPRTGALEGIARYLQLAMEYESHYRLMFGERMSEFQPSPAARKEAVTAFRGLVRVVTRLMPPDSTPAERLRAALQFWAQLHGYVSLKQQVLLYMPGLDDWQSQVLETMAELIDHMMSRPEG